MPGLELSLGLGFSGGELLPGPTDIDITWQTGFEGGAIPESTASNTHVATVSGDYDSVVLLDDAGGQLQLVGSQLRVDTLGTPAFDEFILRGIKNGSNYDETFAFAIVADVVDPPADPPPPGEIDPDPGFENPPEVIEVDDEIVIKGNKKATRSGKFIYDVGAIEANKIYTIRYDPDFSLLANDGVTAFVGFGLKAGQDFHLAGLKGDGAAGLNAYRIHGASWNNASGHTDTDGGVAAHGTQAGPNWLQIQTSADGSTYTLRTSSDGSSWTDEFIDVVPAPHDNAVADYTQFGIAVYLEAADAGSFFIGIELWTEEVASEDPLDPVFMGFVEGVSTPIVYTNAPIGTAHSERLVVAVITWSRSGTPNRNLSSVTFGGSAAVVLDGANIKNDGTGGDVVAVALAYLVVATGTTTTIQANFDGTCQSLGIQVYTIDLKGKTGTPFRQAEATGSATVASTIDVPPDGALIMGALFQNAGGALTFTGASEDNDQSQGTSHTQQGAASAGPLAGETGRSISVAGSGGGAMAALTWGGKHSFATAVLRDTAFNDWSELNVAFGRPTATRVMIVAVTTDAAINHSVSAVTIGGVAAVKRIEGGTNTTRTSSIWTAAVPTGSTGTVRVETTAAVDRGSIHVYRATHLNSAVPHDTDVSTVEPSTININVPANGFVIACNRGHANTAFTWTGVNEDYDQLLDTLRQVSSASKGFVAAQTNLAVTSSQSGGTTQRMVVASFS